MRCFIWFQRQVLRATIIEYHINSHCKVITEDGRELVLYPRDVATDTRGFLSFVARAGGNGLDLPLYSNIFDYDIIINDNGCRIVRS